MNEQNLAWVSGYPAHYMRDFHRKLQSTYLNQIQFTYIALSEKGAAFAHEEGQLPDNANILSSKDQIIPVWRWLNQTKPAAVLISGHYPKANLVAALWAKFKGKKLYYWSDTNIKDSRHTKRSILKQLFIHLFFKLPNVFLYIGTRNKEYYQSKIPSHKQTQNLMFLPLPHNPEMFNEHSKNHPEKFTYLYLGRLSKEKGIDRILKAYATLPTEILEKTIINIAGHGPEEKALKSLAQSLNIASKVNFLGSIMSSVVPQVISTANVIILASDDEPWGLIVNEALSTARPVIGPSSIGSFQDLIKNEQTGFSMPSSAPQNLLKAMTFAAQNPDLLLTMGKNGQDLIKGQQFNITKSVSVIGDILHQLQSPNNKMRETSN